VHPTHSIEMRDVTERVARHYTVHVHTILEKNSVHEGRRKEHGWHTTENKVRRLLALQLAAPASASRTGGHISGTSLLGLPLQKKQASGTRLLAASTAAHFPPGCGGAASCPRWERQTRSRCRCSFAAGLSLSQAALPSHIWIVGGRTP